MTPMDWQDMPQRLSKAEDKVKALTIEVEALRAIVVEQALENKRLKERLRDSIPIAGSATSQVGVGEDARWQNANS